MQLIRHDNVRERDLSSRNKNGDRDEDGDKYEDVGGGCSYIIISQQFQHPEFREIENLLRERAGSEAVMMNDRYHVYRW